MKKTKKLLTCRQIAIAWAIVVQAGMLKTIKVKEVVLVSI